MNKERLTERMLERALADKLKDIFTNVPQVEKLQIIFNPAAFHRAFDIMATLHLSSGHKVELWIECKSNPRPSMFPYVNIEKDFDPNPKHIDAKGRRLFRAKVRVFAAPLISPRMAELCWKHGWSWFDLVGNCRLSVPDVLYVERSGLKPVNKPPRPNANLSTPEAARVLRALLAPDHAGKQWTQRELMLHFGELKNPVVAPSLGLINKVIRHLRDEAFIEDSQEKGFSLRAPLGLLKAWKEAYRFDRHLRCKHFTLLEGKQLTTALARLTSLTKKRVAYAAFSAADFQAPHVRQPKTWLYIGAEYEDVFCKTLEAKQVDSGENLVVLMSEDDGVFYMLEDQSGRLPCTNIAQTYVDLCHCGGRGEEAAEAILEQKLKPVWQKKGLL